MTLEQIENKAKKLQEKEKIETGFNKLSTLAVLEMIKVAQRQNVATDESNTSNEQMVDKHISVR